jgi:hypothetical protein
MLDSLFRFQDAATACCDLANQLLTTVLDGYGRRWMLRTADTTEGQLSRTDLDPPGTELAVSDLRTAAKYSNARYRAGRPGA